MTVIDQPVLSRPELPRAARPDRTKLFRSYARGLTTVLVAEIRRRAPAYAPVLDRAAEEVVGGTLYRFMLCAAENDRPVRPLDQRWTTLCRRLGGAAFAAGHGQGFAPSVFRDSGQTALRRLTAVCRDRQVPATLACVCIEAVFGFVEEICEQAGAGYTAAWADSSYDQETSRRQLLRHLLSGASPQALSELARAADWTPPPLVALVAVEPGDHRLEGRLEGRLGEVLADLTDTEPYALAAADAVGSLPDFGPRIAVGPAVPLDEAAASLAWARRMLDLVRRGVLPDAPVTHWADHLTTLMLHAEPVLLTELDRQCLAPLDAVSPGQRDKLKRTLLSWLTSRGRVADIAAELGVHPQTVRYRMRRIDELFGARLADPDARFALEITLRAERRR